MTNLTKSFKGFFRSKSHLQNLSLVRKGSTSLDGTEKDQPTKLTLIWEIFALSGDYWLDIWRPHCILGSPFHTADKSSHLVP